MKLRILGCSGGIGGRHLRTTSFLLDHDILIDAGTAAADLSIAELAAIEAGAQEFEPGDDGEILFLTDLADLDAVSHALPQFGFTVHSAKLGYRAKNPVTVSSDADREEVEAFLEALDSHDDVQHVYVGLAG